MSAVSSQNGADPTGLSRSAAPPGRSRVVRLFPSRRFLFLQGVPGAFMHALGTALSRRGHGILRINFNGGDRMAWPGLPARDFTGPAEHWGAFLHSVVADFRPTDVVLHGDCRPLHVEAIKLAKRCGLTVHVFEEGYFRPNWITLEIGGVNGHSRLPRELGCYLAAADRLAGGPALAPVAPSVRARVRFYLAYAAACLVLSPHFPHYASHRGWPLLREGVGWIKRAGRRPFVRRRSEAAIRRAFAAPGGFFLLPIQLTHDSQIQVHSDVGGMIGAIRLAAESFARHAPPGSVLAVKEHPLDNGVVDWRAVTREIAAQAGIAGRMVLIEDCALERLLDRTIGVVTVNSTSATFALARGIPVIALGRAVYGLAGLTFERALDEFWHDRTPPLPGAFEAFQLVLTHACLIKGDFFTPEGVAHAVRGAVPRMEAGEDARARVARLASFPASDRARRTAAAQ